MEPDNKLKKLYFLLGIQPSKARCFGLTVTFSGRFTVNKMVSIHFADEKNILSRVEWTDYTDVLQKCKAIAARQFMESVLWVNAARVLIIIFKQTYLKFSLKELNMGGRAYKWWSLCN